MRFFIKKIEILLAFTIGTIIAKYLYGLFIGRDVLW